MATVTKYPTGYSSGNVFTNPQNAYADDGVVATRTSTTRNQNESSYWRDFGFAIPGNAIVQQIDVEGECAISTAVTGRGFGVQLFVGTTAYGTEATNPLTNANTYYVAKQTLTSGLPTIAELNSSGDTGLRVRVRIYTGNTTTSRTFSLDFVRVTVTYTVPEAVGRTFVATYTLRGRAAKALAPAYSLRARVARAFAASYAILQQAATVARALSPAYALRGRSSKSLATAYPLRGRAAQALSPAYALRALAASAIAAAYRLRGRAASALSASYAVLQQAVAVGQALNVDYAVRRAVARAAAVIYSVRSLAAAQRAVLYALRGLAGRSLSAAYAILSSAASVARDLAVSYVLRGRSSSSRAVAYAVRSLVAAWLDARYDVTAAQRVASALPAAYSLRGRLAAVLVARYRLGRFAAGGAAVDLRAWRERQPVKVGSAFGCVYAVRAGTAPAAPPLPGAAPAVSPTPVLPTAQRPAAPVVTRSRLEVSYALAALPRREAAPARDPLAPTIAAIEAVAPRLGRILRLARASRCDG